MWTNLACCLVRFSFYDGHEIVQCQITLHNPRAARQPGGLWALVHFLKTCCVRAFAGSATLLGKEGEEYLLKIALRGVLPDVVLDLPKMGFSAPIAHCAGEQDHAAVFGDLLVLEL